MGRNRRESIDRKSGVPSRDEDPNADLLERIRQLEEENKRLKGENKAFKEEIDVYKEEIDIYKEVLKSEGLFAEDILAQRKGTAAQGQHELHQQFEAPFERRLQEAGAQEQA